MWTPSSEDPHFCTVQFGRLNFGFLVVVVFHPDMENKNNPNVAEILQSVQRTAVYFIKECKFCSCVLDKATLSRCAELLPKTGF